MPADPLLSVVIVFHNMTREAPRTLHTLSRAYQQNIADLSYEIIAIDNGSSRPLSQSLVGGFGERFQYEYFPTTSVSPVDAVNHGVARASGEYVMVMIDGAHLLTPGVLARTAEALRILPDPFVATVPVHLGPGAQHATVETGYNQDAEDRLLEQVDWRRDGYELLRLTGSPADSSLGWFGCLFESNCFTLRKSTFHRLGGYDTRFMSRGGGFVNLDFFRNAVESPGVEYVLLLGEASLHQFHGGVATNAPKSEHPWEQFSAEYARIRGRPYDRPHRRPVYFGSLSDQAIPLTRVSAQAGLSWWEKNPER